LRLWQLARAMNIARDSRLRFIEEMAEVANDRA
jgi:hypothetical protein